MDNKSRFFRIKITKQFRGRYAEQTVYSILVKTIRNNAGLTKKTIAERTGLDRGETVKKACAWLIEVGLAELRNGRIWAKEPPTPTWFHWKSPAKPDWWDRLQYISEYVPNRERKDRLSPRTNSVFWMFVSWECKGTFPKIATVAKQLGLSRDCVGDCVKELQNRGLMDDVHQVIVAGKQDYWQDKKEKRKPKPVEIRKRHDRFAACLFGQYTNFREYKPKLCKTLDQLIDKLGLLIEKMRKVNYSDAEIEALILAVFKVAEDWPVVEAYVAIFARKALEYVEQVTTDNRLTRAFSGRNSRGAMQQISERLVRTLRTRWATKDVCWWDFEPDFKTVWCSGGTWKNG